MWWHIVFQYGAANSRSPNFLIFSTHISIKTGCNFYVLEITVQTFTGITENSISYILCAGM